MKLATKINSGILLAAITLIPGIAAAQTVTSSNINQAVNSKVYLQLFNTAFLAYQGYLKNQGIPSAGALVFAYQTETLTAKDVVQAAVKDNKLPAEVLNDKDYINAVDLELKWLSNDSSN
ncbi:MAG: hypothetical protein V7L11_05690 [Nostoc sp.]|uniref:hypothetical protein n=1 Tax=Nostoc sp. TaxID=1180 RepID=UPI002FFB3CEE